MLSRPGCLLTTRYPLWNKVLHQTHQNLADPKGSFIEDTHIHTFQHLLWDFCLFPQLVDLSQPHFTRLYYRDVYKAINVVWLQIPWWTQSLPGHIVPVLLQWQTVVQKQIPRKFSQISPHTSQTHNFSCRRPCPTYSQISWDGWLWIVPLSQERWIQCPHGWADPEPGETFLMTGPSWSYPANLGSEHSCHWQNKPAVFPYQVTLN